MSKRSRKVVDPDTETVADVEVADSTAEVTPTPLFTAAAAEPQVESAVLNPVVVEPPKDPYPRAKALRSSIATYKTFINGIKISKPADKAAATGYLIGVFNSALKIDEQGGYQDVLNMFDECGSFLDPLVALQGIASYPQATVKKIGSFYAVMHALHRHLKSRGKIPFNMDIKGITSIFESSTLSNFIALKLSK